MGKYFVSYAHKTQKLAHHFLDIFEGHATLSETYQFEKWIDGDIILGENWHTQIQSAIQECNFGLLLLSATYFNRTYIKEQELSHFLSKEGKNVKVIKSIVPVGLKSFNLSGDLLGLEQTQIYRYQKEPGAEERFYNQLRKNQRIEFVRDLLEKMKVKFDGSASPV